MNMIRYTSKKLRWNFLKSPGCLVDTNTKSNINVRYIARRRRRVVQMGESLCVVMCCASDKVNNQRKCVVDMVWLTSGERRQCLFIICTAGWSVVWYRVEGVGKG